MKTSILRIALSLALGLLALAGAIALLESWHSGPPVAQAQGTTRYVSSVTGSDAGDCTDPSAPCKTIQYAVDRASNGDEIWIATLDVDISGFSPITTTARYTGTAGNVIELTKTLTLRGGYVYAHSPLSSSWTPGSVPATVDGEGARRPLYVSGNVTPTLELLSFVNGHADRGGNVYAEDATLRFVATQIMSGSATYGGGLYLKNCRTSFDAGNLNWQDLLGLGSLVPVQNNTAQYGGGVYVEGGTPVLSGLYVYSNTATYDGGGFYLQGGSPLVVGGLVMNNQAGNWGGGFYLDESTARIAANAVYSNTAASGGGLYLNGPFAFSEETVPIIANNYIRHNHTTSGQGGGLYFRQAIAGLVNNVIADNAADYGAAMYLWASSPQLFHNTIAQNSGNSGIYLTHKPGSYPPPVLPIPSRPSFTNTIIVSHTVGIYVASTSLPDPFQNKATLEGTLWWGNASGNTAGPGPVVHSTDVYSVPRFTCTDDPPDCQRPYHVLTDSAAVDAGVIVALTLPGSDQFVDIDGELRPSGEGYDIGADEVVSDAYSAWLVPTSSALLAEPGQTVTHTHRLLNSGTETDTYTVTVTSSAGWSTLATSSVITLAAQTSTTVQVRVNVPPTATNGMADTAAVVAASQSDISRQASALDVTTVYTGPQADLSVGKWASEDVVCSGCRVHFTLVVTNAGPLTETLAVTITDQVIPTQTIHSWALPSGCTGTSSTGMVTCVLTLPEGTLPVTTSLELVITTTDTYTGLLVNQAEVHSAALDPDPSNNSAQAVVGVSCVEISSVTIAGPTKGITGTPYVFIAAVAPSTATLPITYTWQATGQTPVVHVSGLSDAATFTWTVTGTQVVTVTAANACGVTVSDTHVIIVEAASLPPCTALDAVSIAGPPTTTVGVAVSFIAAVAPPTATLPITYVWEATGQTPVIHISSLSDTAVFTWAVAGTQAVTVTAVNACGVAVSDIHVITVEAAQPRQWYIYLPVVLKNYGP